MQLWELILVAVGLSMDAFAVSICKGLSLKKMKWKYAALTGLYFGAFQGGMPLIGFFLGSRFSALITNVDHWIAFVLLGIIGLNMIKEARENPACPDASFTVKTMLVLALATSIDALAVGVTLAFLQVKIVPAAALIGCTTFLLSALGVKIGSVFGCRFKAGAEYAGGIILICMGTKILLEHLGIL